MKKIFRHHLSRADQFREHRMFRIFGNSLLHPRLWHLNRRSAAGGVAVGLFCSLIPGPLQMVGAAVLCVLLRVNLPVALLGTLFSNPVTIVPLYFAAFYLGRAVSGGEAEYVPPPPFEWGSFNAIFDNWHDWLMSLGEPLLIGLPLLACAIGGIGYGVTRYGWEFWLRRQWLHRRARRASAPPGP